MCTQPGRRGRSDTHEKNRAGKDLGFLAKSMDDGGTMSSFEGCTVSERRRAGDEEGTHQSEFKRELACNGAWQSAFMYNLKRRTPTLLTEFTSLFFRSVFLPSHSVCSFPAHWSTVRAMSEIKIGIDASIMAVLIDF